MKAASVRTTVSANEAHRNHNSQHIKAQHQPANFLYQMVIVPHASAVAWSFLCSYQQANKLASHMNSSQTIDPLLRLNDNDSYPMPMNIMFEEVAYTALDLTFVVNCTHKHAELCTLDRLYH